MTDPSAAARIASDYDSVPYFSIPRQDLHPARIGAIARLCGLDSALAATARVLEVGCASGGHLIPLAAMFPDARFLGVDISPVQIADGRQRIERLGLHNIELSARSFTDLAATETGFDYILCHGVYSWIPQELREALMEVCARSLAPNGVAVVSYNVLPGGHALQMIRDSVLQHAGGERSHAEKIAATRRLFALMSKHAPEDKNYGRVWRELVGLLEPLPDAYLLHELFEEHNVPLTFTQFMEGARRHGLAYLADAMFAANIVDNAGGERGDVIRDLAGSDLLEQEKYFDLFTGRAFRSSLLYRDGDAASADRSFPLARFEDLHFIAPLKFKVSRGPEGAWMASDGEGEQVPIDDDDVADALALLAARLPCSSRLSDLVSKDGETKALRVVLRRLACTGLLIPATEPVRCATRIDVSPRAWPVAASDAAAGMQMTATLRHATFEISPLARVLLPLLDGTRDRSALAEVLLQVASSGGASVTEGGKPVTDRARILEFCHRTVDRELETYSSVGLLTEA